MSSRKDISQTVESDDNETGAISDLRPVKVLERSVGREEAWTGEVGLEHIAPWPESTISTDDDEEADG